MLCILYTPPLSSMIFGHSIAHHLDAKDSQLYIFFASGDSVGALNGLIVFGLHPVMDVDEQTETEPT